MRVFGESNGNDSEGGTQVMIQNETGFCLQFNEPEHGQKEKTTQLASMVSDSPTCRTE